MSVIVRIGALLAAGCLFLAAGVAEAGAARVAVAEGVSLRVVRSGAPSDRAPVIFVPGWSTDADIWAEQMRRLGGDREVIAFDPRSQGASSLTLGGNTPEQRARDLAVLVDRLQLSRPPVLVGWSQGVQDVTAYVGQFGDSRIAGVVLVDAAVSSGAPAASQRPEDVATLLGRLDLYVAHQPEYLKGMMQAIITRPQEPGVIEALVATGLRTPPSIGVAQLIADLYGADRSGALAGLRKPALIVAAAGSPERERMAALAAALADGRLEVVADAGHAVFLDQPDKFAAILSDFLARIDPQFRPA